MTVAPSKDDVFQRLRRLTGPRIRRSSEKYANTCPGPLSDPDDFEQNVYLKLYEWLDDPVHLEQAEGLLEDVAEAAKFMQQFTRARICDHIDINCAGPRDQRLTLHASQQVYRRSSGEKGDMHETPFLELLVHPPDARQQTSTEPVSLRIAEIKKGLPRLAVRLLDVLIDPPAQVREAFAESRLRISKGMATLAEPLCPHDDCVLRLDSREGYQSCNTTISWPGPLRRGEINTTAGPARLTLSNGKRPGERKRITIRFGTKLTVYLDRQSLEGEFIWESVRPSPSPFDIGVVADYLGSKMKTLRDAWIVLRAALGVDFPGKVPDIP